MSNPKDPPSAKPKQPQSVKQEKLAAALRQNLQRRKAVITPKKPD